MRGHKANDFERIRADHKNEVMEDYVEAIAKFESEHGRCRGADLARYFSVSHPTVTQTVARLKEAGLVEIEPYGPIALTKEGKSIAKKSRQRHEVVFAFLLSLGVSESVAAVDTEGIEHHVSDETLRCMKRRLRDREG
ncbi:MAG: manganese-binding transcriptional regulator MntR [Planctomycetales bacterium]|nr:manganese-binding transcriptional regulator MntR [Planctomycetales bacterium]